MIIEINKDSFSSQEDMEAKLMHTDEVAANWTYLHGW